MGNMVRGMLQSMDRDGRHQAALQDIEILSKVGDNDYIVRTPSGVCCHAIFNSFTGFYFADDVYRIVSNDNKEDRQT